MCYVMQILCESDEKAIMFYTRIVLTHVSNFLQSYANAV